MDASVKAKVDIFLHGLKLFLGMVALVVGIAGIVLPILPGWILVFLGIELIGIKIVFIDNIKEYARLKFLQVQEKRGKK